MGVEGGLGQITFVDFCAGLGGFHKGLTDAAAFADIKLGRSVSFKCVAASELESDLRESYVANFPEVSETYSELHYESTRVERSKGSAPDALLKALPEFDNDGRLTKIHGDMTWFLDDSETELRKAASGKTLLPAHDLLCAGFPCQPFSKSGAQRGFDDTRGTVFHTIATILKEKRPAFLLLENVGNFAKHDGGNTWLRVRNILEDELGYDIVATEHVSTGDSTGLISPHHFGFPHHRERFFIIGQRKKPSRKDSELVRELLQRPLSKRHALPRVLTNALSTSEESKRLDAIAKAKLIEIISSEKDASEKDELVASQLSFDRVRCINHWGKLLEKLAELDQLGGTKHWQETMPSFPIWGYELDPWNWYPIDKNPADSLCDLEGLIKERKGLIKDARELVAALSNFNVDLRKHPPQGNRNWLGKPMNHLRTYEWINSWPGYAGKREVWPSWKQRFIRQNREWAVKLWASVDPIWLRNWLDTLYDVIRVPSNQKLEWNCKGEDLEIWKHILQFRPSGLRVKRLAHVPALVAMTTTQVPIVPRMNQAESVEGAESASRGRHLIPSEALQLQGFPSGWVLPNHRERAFTCFGNAVHVGVVSKLVENWLLNRH